MLGNVCSMMTFSTFQVNKDVSNLKITVSPLMKLSFVRGKIRFQVSLLSVANVGDERPDSFRRYLGISEVIA